MVLSLFSGTCDHHLSLFSEHSATLKGPSPLPPSLQPVAICPLSVSVCFSPCVSCPWVPSRPLLLTAEQCSVVWTAYIPSLHWVVSSLETGSSSQQPFSPHVISRAARGLSLPGPRLPTHPPHRQPRGHGQGSGTFQTPRWACVPFHSMFWAAKGSCRRGPHPPSLHLPQAPSVPMTAATRRRTGQDKPMAVIAGGLGATRKR